MSFFEHKLNLKVKLNTASDNQEARFDFKLENHTPNYILSASDINITTNEFEVGTEIFEVGQKVQFDTDGILPSPLVSAQDYYINSFSTASPNTITFSEIFGGSTIDLTTSGTGSHEIKAVVNTGNYRIVSYHNIRWDKSTMNTTVGAALSTSGDTNGTLVLISPDEKSYNTPEFPPRIAPMDGRFSYRARTKLGSANFIGDGSSYSDMYISVKHVNNLEFVTYPANGQLEYAIDNSYSSTSATSYEDNSSFILERNIIDPNITDSDNWVSVQEYLDSNTLDSNTGEYPYGPLIKDQTSIDHYATHADKDATIRLSTPNSNYGSTDTLDLYDSTGTNVRRPMFHFELSNIASDNITEVENWFYCNNSTDGFNEIVDIVSLSADFNENSVTWNNGNQLFTEVITSKDASVISGSSWSNSYIPVSLPVSAVQDWISTSANNGIGIKYSNEGTIDESSPTIASTENPDYYKRPLMVVSYYGTSGATNVSITPGVTSTDIQMISPVVGHGIQFETSALTDISTEILLPSFVGNPNISATANISSVSAWMGPPNIGSTTGLPFNVSGIGVDTDIVQPYILVEFNESTTLDLPSVSTSMLTPFIFSERLVPSITFSNHNPQNKTAILPNGNIVVEVTVENNNAISYNSIGLTNNSLSGANITSAWQVDSLTAKAIISVSANDNINGSLEVSAQSDLGTMAVSADIDYRFVSPTSATAPLILITNYPANRIIDPNPVYATVQVISPGYTELQSFGFISGSVGTLVTSGIYDPLIPYPNLRYTIEIDSPGELMVSADDIYENVTSASSGLYVKYGVNPSISCSGKELDLVNFLPGHLKTSEVGEFMRFFEEFLNNMYYCQNSYKDNPEKQSNEFKISILEKIFRLSTLHDPDTIDMDYIQFFANYLGYDINISRGDLGNLASSDLTSINTDGTSPNVDISDSVVSQKYLRFAVRNLPNWYRIKTTRNAIKVMLFSFGLVGDILTNFTSPIENGGYTDDSSKWMTYDDRYSDSSLLSQVPPSWFNTPHFSIAVDYDNSPPNWFKQLPLILDAIESIRPINTVLDEISSVIKRQTEKISVNAASRYSMTRYFSCSTEPEPIDPNLKILTTTEDDPILTTEDENIFLI